MIVGLKFLHLTKSKSQESRKLAHALGLATVADRWPLHGTHVISHAARNRDAEVDRWMQQKILEQDPMAESIQGDSLDNQERLTRFNATNPPAYLPVQFDAFVTDDGRRIDAITINMVTTPKRDASVMMELTVDNLQWLTDAFAASNNDDWAPEPQPKKSNVAAVGDMDAPPPLTSGIVQYCAQNGERKHLLFCWYRTNDGKRKRIQRSLHTDPSNEFVFRDEVARMEEEMVRFHAENNHEKDTTPSKGPTEMAICGEQDQLESSALSELGA